MSKLDTNTCGGFADIHGIPPTHLRPEKFTWTQTTLPIRQGGLGLIPALRIADAAYVGSVTDASELSSVLTGSIHDEHPYDSGKIVQEVVTRIQDTHGLDDTYRSSGL